VDELPPLSRAELALLDRLAVEEHGLPVLVLMENAGRGAAEEILRRLAASPAAGRERLRAVVLAGPGHNGGDAYVVARHLANAGAAVLVFASAPPASDDVSIMRRAAEAQGIPVHAADETAGEEDLADALAGAHVVVDGLLGTGFKGTDLRPAVARLVAAIAARRRAPGSIVVALDVPSGLDADTGEAADPCVAADLTITFAAQKLGFASPAARARVGEVVVASIGTPPDLVRRVHGVHPPAAGSPPRTPGDPQIR